MKRATAFILFLLMSVMFIQAQDAPASADDIMNKAIKIAKKEKKDIIVMFHASWCGWCKRMDAAMMDETCKDFFNDNFVITHMVVMEHGEKAKLDNPGAKEMMDKYHGAKSGIPFWLIFNKKGELITDSFIRKDGVGMDQAGSNIGCPAQDNEIAAFIEKLKLATKVSPEMEEAITLRFRKNNPANNK